jgi:hypothetical protein
MITTPSDVIMSSRRASGKRRVQTARPGGRMFNRTVVAAERISANPEMSAFRYA